MFQVAPFGGSFTGGVRVARGDVNGDGTPDLIVAAGPGGGPRIKVYDGATHAVIYSYYAYTASFTGGVSSLPPTSTATVRRTSSPHSRAAARTFTYFPGRTALLTQFFAYSSSFRGGVSVAGGDIHRQQQSGHQHRRRPGGRPAP